jgi:hypothetical protein
MATRTRRLFAGLPLRAPRRRLRGALVVLCVGIVSDYATNPSFARAQTEPAADLRQVAAGFQAFFMHDECIGENVAQPDTCLHARVHEKSFTFGGTGKTVYGVTLRVRGLFEPTTVEGGDTPDAAHPYFKVGGQSRTLDYSQWLIDVSEPKRTYTLNHYPSVSHTIHKEDFEATIEVAAGATVVIRSVDSNDRQIDNGAKGRPDRQQIIEGVVDTPLAGQMVRLDVIRVAVR